MFLFLTYASLAQMDTTLEEIIAAEAMEGACRDVRFLKLAEMTKVQCRDNIEPSVQSCLRLMDAYVPPTSLSDESLNDAAAREKVTGLPPIVVKCAQAWTLFPGIAIEADEVSSGAPGAKAGMGVEDEDGLLGDEDSRSSIVGVPPRMEALVDRYRSLSPVIDDLVSEMSELGIDGISRDGGSVLILDSSGNIGGVESVEGADAFVSRLAKRGVFSISAWADDITVYMEDTDWTPTHFVLSFLTRGKRASAESCGDYADSACGVCRVDIGSGHLVHAYWAEHRVMQEAKRTDPSFLSSCWQDSSNPAFNELDRSIVDSLLGSKR